MSFQIFILVGHLTNWTGHHLLTDNTLKKITQDVLVRCSVIVSDHNVKLAGHFQNLVGQCPMTDCYFQHCMNHVSVSPTDGNGPTQGQRKTLTRVGIEPTTHDPRPRRFSLITVFALLRFMANMRDMTADWLLIL